MTAAPGDGAASRILVVDDAEANRDLLARRLRRQGHAVETAENGSQALDRLRDAPFDLVLLDIMMPEMNGYEVLERLKGDDALRHIPVVMITALTETESVARCIGMGAEDHLPKPFDPMVLRARVDASLAKKRLRDREQMHARSLERELEIGRTIQAGFLPEELPGVPGWEIAARFRPARQVAGDFYDVFTLARGGGPDPSPRVALVVADVCDKGVGAALFMALFRSLVRVVLAQRYAAAAPPPDAEQLTGTVRVLNDYIATTHGRANMFATLFVAVLDPATGALAYVNGGHDAPAVRGASGVRRLAPTGPAVGLMAGLPFASADATLAPGDLLLAFTDGVTDARGGDGAPFGEDRLLAHLGAGAADNFADEADALLARLDDDVRAHAAGADPFDDITMLAVRRAGAVRSPP